MTPMQQGMQGGQTSMDPSQMGAPDPQAMAQIPQAPQQAPIPDTPPATPKTQMREMMESVNIAEKLSDEEIEEIGNTAKAGFDDDLETRAEWDRCVDEWTRLAIQHKDQKTFPWPGASNVKYPLLSTAAMQFSARAYPSLIPSDGKIVKAQIIGKDLDGKKTELAGRVSTYMSWQLMTEMDGWEEDMDKLLIMLPIMGTMFKKTYWDSSTKKNCSKLIMPKNFVVNYWTRNLKDCERMSEIMFMSKRKIKEKQLAGIYLDVDLGDPTNNNMPHKDNMPSFTDETTPYQIIEQHTYLDLNDDDYYEPYIVTFERASGKVLRIAARYDDTTMFFDDEDKLIKVDPIEYYTKFSFIPNPDGGFYDIGFGTLLGPINESVNTLINQLTDSGTLNNMQSGFIGKGLRIKMGDSRFNLGEWKAVNATGDDLKKQILPLPTKEPSAVLFQLMGTMITSGKELASVAEIFVGKMPGQNTPATTTMATIEQGMKVFTAVYKRIYRSLASEIDKLFRLNHVYLDPQTEAIVLDAPIGPDDFGTDKFDIKPGADPTAISQTEKLVKAQGLMELMPMGTLDPVKVTMRILEAQEQPNWQELMSPSAGQPKPDPKQLELQMKGQADQQKFAAQQQQDMFKSELSARDQKFQQAMQAQSQAQDERHEAIMNTIKASAILHQDNARTLAAAQKIHQDQQTHQQKISNMKEAALVKRATSVSGKGKK